MLEDLHNNPSATVSRWRIREAQTDVREIADKIREIGNGMVVTLDGIRNIFTLFTATFAAVVDFNLFNSTQHVLLASNNSAGLLTIHEAVRTRLLHYFYDDGTMQNARKHARWVALSVVRTRDPEFVRLFTDAHEFGGLLGRHFNTDLAGGFPNYQHSFMDLHNNAVGLRIGKEAMSAVPDMEMALRHANGKVSTSRDLVSLR